LHYMAPEQLEGRDADVRTDIFAFGGALYEMLTGRKAFEGTSHASLIAAILDRDPPPVSSSQPLTSPGLDRIVAKCLAKDPEARWQTARDLHDELRWVAESRFPGVAAATDRPVHARFRERAGWTLTALAMVLAAAVAWLSLRSTAPPPITIRFEIPTPPTESATSFALSRDGRWLVYVATSEGRSQLWFRPLSEAAAQPLSGTEGATFPFWAPDGRALGFFADGKLKRLDIGGGTPQVLADAPVGRGGTWSAEDVILFTPVPLEPGVVMRVPASGGTPVPVTRLTDDERSHRSPQFLPDGRQFLFFSALARPDVQGVYLGSLDNAEQRRLLFADASAAFVPPGRLVFVRGDVLLAVPFDPGQGTVTGEPARIAQPIGRDDSSFSAMFSVSPDVLAYRTTGGGGIRSQLMWMDRAGKVLQTVGVPMVGLGAPELDPTDQRVAVVRIAMRNIDVWLMDASRGTLTRFTFNPTVEGPSVWSPDGRRVVFLSVRDEREALYEKSASGAGDERVIAADAGAPLSWSPDGRFLLYSRPDMKTGMDLWVLPMTGEPKPLPVVQGAMDQRGGEFSPDGRWLVYESNESGRFEVYVQPFPEAGGKWQVSSAGGTQPRWRRDGRELYYVAPDARLMAVAVAPGADGTALSFGAPVPLFQTRLVSASDGPARQSYAVARDGRFLMSTIVDDPSASPISVVVNWTQLLEAR
ncbi:MAG: protein kinase domain-containing protein, partial [Vicinamibacterales bacterium]